VKQGDLVKHEMGFVGVILEECFDGDYLVLSGKRRIKCRWRWLKVICEAG